MDRKFSLFLYSLQPYITKGLTKSQPFHTNIINNLSDNALLKHCTCNFHEACYIGTLDIVDIAVRLCTIFYAGLVDG